MNQASASTPVDGPYAFMAPLLAPPSSMKKSSVRVGSTVNGGRVIGETPNVAGGRIQHIQVADGEASRPNQLQVQGVPMSEAVLTMKQRLLTEGVESAMVDCCVKIFEQGITIDALEAQMTPEESEKYGAVGKRYRQMLEMVGEEGMRKVHRCRLCRSREYKNHRDALRHLLKSHFRMGYLCEW